MTSTTSWTTSKWAMIPCPTTPPTSDYLKDPSRESSPKLKRRFLAGIFLNEREDCCKTERVLWSAELKNKTSLSASKALLTDWVAKTDHLRKRYVPLLIPWDAFVIEFDWLRRHFFWSLILFICSIIFLNRSPLSTLCWHARMRKTKASTKSTASCNFNRRSFWLVISLKMESTSRIFQGNLEIKLPKMPSTVLLKINRVNLWRNLPPTSRSQAEEKLSKVTTRSPAKSNSIFWLWKKTS